MMSQLFGDRLQIANATGCSSIYGANLPTTPWAANADGRGPAWSNSLFEDNAEFGLGYRLAVDSQTAQARVLLQKLAPRVGEDLVTAVLQAPQVTESDFRVQRERVAAVKAEARGSDRPGRGRICSRSRTSWCGDRCGLSAATAGPTTSTTAASTTSSPRGRT